MDRENYKYILPFALEQQPFQESRVSHAPKLPERLTFWLYKCFTSLYFNTGDIIFVLREILHSSCMNYKCLSRKQASADG